MSTNHKPATPLPWSVLIEDGANAICGRIDPVTGKAIPRGRDVAYIAHAANAYPQLVRALREAADNLDYRGGKERADAYRAILRELGEAE